MPSNSHVYAVLTNDGKFWINGLECTMLDMDIVRQYPNIRMQCSMLLVCSLVRILLDYVNSLQQSLHHLHLFRSSIDQCLRLIKYFRWQKSEPQHFSYNKKKTKTLCQNPVWNKFMMQCLIWSNHEHTFHYSQSTWKLNLCISMNFSVWFDLMQIAMADAL